MASNSAFFDVLSKCRGERDRAVGIFSEDVAAALVRRRRCDNATIAAVENVKLVVKTKRPHKRRKGRVDAKERRRSLPRIELYNTRDVLVPLLCAREKKTVGT